MGGANAADRDGPAHGPAALALSAVICTHKRVARLRAALESFRRMIPPPRRRWELVVVDNRSLDGTDRAVAEFAATSSFPVRYIFEPRLGVAAARNRGIAESQGDVIAFTDDDCLVDAHWAARIVEEFARDPALLLLGGRVELYDPGDAPIAIRTGRERREIGGDPTAFEHLIGANMAMRRAVLQQAGGFDMRFGGGSGVVSSAEDTEFFYRVLRLTGHVAYVPDVLVHHHHGRRHVENKLRSFEYAQGRGCAYAKHVLKGDLTMMKMVWWEVGALLRASAGFGADADRADSRAALRGLMSGVAAFLLRGLRRPGVPPV